ncbi:MAG: iron complex outermembrane receptor protein [Enterobacterales bacterium]|jgi:iron complex outermembrane receptor protein
MFMRIFIVLFLLVVTSVAFCAEELEAITVQSTAFEGYTQDEFAQSIEVIQGAELERKKSNSIGETINNELGVSSTYFAPGASRPIIRGLGSNRVRVLENGIDSLDASSLSEDHAVSIEPFIANQIEILRGPATLRYGPGAIGGVVNVINKRIPQSLDRAPLEFKGLAEHATVSDGNTAAFELNGAIDSFGWHVDGLTRNTNDYEIDGFANEEEPTNKGKLSNSDIETDNYGVGGSIIKDSGMVGIAFSRLDSNYGIPGAAEGDIRIDLKQYRYDAQAELYNPASGIELISLRTAFNNYRHFEVEESGEIATTFDNEEIETRLEVINRMNDQWKNAFGLQYNDREFSAVGVEAFIQPVDEKRYGIFAITHFHNDMWDLEAGLRFDRDEFEPEMDVDKEFDIYSLSLGAQRKITNDMQLNIFATRAERAPQETALYADGPHLATLTFETGSDDIEKETSYNLELGLEQMKDSYSWRVNTYYNRIDDYIYLAPIDANNDGIADRVDGDGMFDPAGELLAGIYQNDDVTFYGIEAEFITKLINNDSYELSGRVFGDYVRAQFRNDDLGNVPRITPPRFGVGVEGSQGTWNGNIDLIFVVDQNNEGDLETDTDGYTMLNAGINKTLYLSDTDINVFIKGENLLDEDARQHTSFQKDRVVLPGRGIKLGLSLNY